LLIQILLLIWPVVKLCLGANGGRPPLSSVTTPYSRVILFQTLYILYDFGLSRALECLVEISRLYFTMSGIDEKPAASSTVLETATAGDGAPVVDDDLQLALHAIRGNLERVSLSDGRLTASPSSDTTRTTAFTSAELIEFSRHGCVRLSELVHNHIDNKTEALDRGALLALKEALQRHDDGAVRIASLKALRSICFKNDEARNKLQEHAIVEALTGLLGDTADFLEATKPDDKARITSLLSQLEENASTITAVINRHDGNAAAAKACGADAAVAKAKKATETVDPTLATEAKKKLMFLSVMLE
jgi:hypothetical protein